MYPVIGGVTRGVDSHRLATRSAIRQARSMIDATGSLLVAGAGGGGGAVRKTRGGAVYPPPPQGLDQ